MPSDPVFRPAFLQGRIRVLAHPLARNITVQLGASGPGPAENPDGSFNVWLVQPDIEECHNALGRFMDSWSNLERCIALLLKDLLSIEENNVPVLMNSLGTRGQLDVINSLGASIFDADSTNVLEDITNQIKTANTRRNYLVHGYWMYETVVNQYQSRIVYKSFSYRKYNPSSLEELNKLDQPVGFPDVRRKYMFRVKRILQLSDELNRITLELSRFRSHHFEPKIIKENGNLPI